ncbi:MAG TPA: RNA-binding cell elongation regulator Jag/EloR [Syntrophales bacterium]|nr:RNA-binding cell elongation regulator Jag/EloR [Syntrophales bacterium]
MMHLKEYEGKSIDEAIENACKALNVPREKLKIEILSEGSSGFFGLGSKKARIKAVLLTLETATRGREFETAPDTRDEKPAPIEAPGVGIIEKKPAPAEAPPEISAEQAREILEGILKRMSLEAPVTVEETDDRITLNIHGDGGGLLIGKRGKNLDALQYIVSKAVNRRGETRKMVIIDTETYRKRREESLVAMAKELGEKARRTQKPITVSHMNAHNRRIIHMALQNEEGLTTKSRGEGEFRKILILPERK